MLFLHDMPWVYCYIYNLSILKSRLFRVHIQCEQSIIFFHSLNVWFMKMEMIYDSSTLPALHLATQSDKKETPRIWKRTESISCMLIRIAISFSYRNGYVWSVHIFIMCIVEILFWLLSKRQLWYDSVWSEKRIHTDEVLLHLFFLVRLQFVLQICNFSLLSQNIVEEYEA